MKFLHIRYNLLAGTEILSLSVYEPIAIYILLGGRASPNLGKDRAMRWLWNPVKLLHIKYNLFAGTEMLSLAVYEPIAIQILSGGIVPEFGGGGRARESGVVPSETPPY